MCRVHLLHVSSSSPPTPHRPPLMQTKPDPLETQRNSRPPDPSPPKRENQSHHDPRRRLQRHPTQDDAPRVTPDSPSEPVDQSSWPLRPRPPTSSDTSNTSHRCLPGPPTSTYLTTTSAFTPMCRVHSLHVSSTSPPTPHRPPLMQTKPDPLETQRNSRPPDPSVVRRALTDCSQRKNTKHSDESNRPQPCHHPRLPTYFRRIPQAATPLTAITRHRSVAGTPSPRQ
ncbi:hypothetical protein TGME49_280070 [Toxoplasma gondii ME49]|uniref:Uncharacterized protein n=1 Tax=Toxoplasma gondii (strain ATCC 50611 / Me49) TaxID=508771 RepID=S8GDF8_TOXGM|nr:hypothetical protein TGME49_280070 [Toxoplasma gondii ME49]EPT29820.1 hypothetical protein TGME49_280070 [Toxoplasma gondii ME49]|eukprot:XP_018637199.1 hypothetical protein TGME49_280070 [Toxoplasma gondii ME49]